MEIEGTYMYGTQAPWGAALLDMKRPGWRAEINLETMLIRKFNLCVLAQLYGSYEEGLRVLGLLEDFEEVFRHGFSLPSGMGQPWALLQEEWELLIREGLPG